MLYVQTKVHSNVRFRSDVDSSFDPMSNSNCFYCGKSDVSTSFFFSFLHNNNCKTKIHFKAFVALVWIPILNKHG